MKYNKVFTRIRFYGILLWIILAGLLKVGTVTAQDSMALRNLNITVQDCTMKELDGTCLGTLDVYRLPENTIARRVILNKYLDNSVSLENLTVGMYRVVLINSLGHDVQQEVVLQNQDTTFMSICIDSILVPAVNTIEQLKDNDSIVVDFLLSGCFYAEEKRLVILKQSEMFTATLYYVSSEQTFQEEVLEINTSTKHVVLNRKQLENYVRFENELAFVTKPICTITHYYRIQALGNTLEIADGSCQWNGFHRLLQSYFGE